MAEVNDNLITRGLSGQLGKQIVFRRDGEKTIVAKAPKKGPRTLSEDQLVHQAKFIKAAVFARGQMRNPVSRAQYLKEAKKRKLKGAYVAAISDFFNEPQITEVVFSEYTGAVDSILSINVDDVFVTMVDVSIYDSTGAAVESGQAVKSEVNGDWTYKAKVANPTPNNYKVSVMAEDRAGNRTTKDFAKF